MLHYTVNQHPHWACRQYGHSVHGRLYRWTENSFPFFLYQKLKEILIRYIRIILKASKDRLISKI